jgi:tryptophanyl-tRNA synthetase
MSATPVILTGDRPTGPLHLGHYIGSLANRVTLQDRAEQFIIIADAQALTDNYNTPEKVRDNVYQVLLDYLAVGVDPRKSTIFIQSLIPQIPELTLYYLNLVTINRLRRNPTVKTEILQKGFKENVPAGFLMYPINQAADITAFRANLVPVGEDQLPVIEQTNEIVRTFNRLYNTTVLVEAEPLIPAIARLPGIDGKAKMSKSLGNAIYLSDPLDIIAQKVRAMYTDPNHIRVSDPGTVEGNTVFMYLDAFDPDKKAVEELKSHYRRGGLGDMVIKKRLLEILEAFLKPIQERRIQLATDKAYLQEVLRSGTAVAESVAAQTLTAVKKAMHLLYF